MTKLNFAIVTFFIINLFISSYVMGAPFSQDVIYIFDSYEDFSKGYYDNISLSSDGSLKLSLNSYQFSPQGKYTSDVIKTTFPVDEIYPSWNIVCPKDRAGFKIYIRVSSDNKNWSGWYYMGAWGKYPEKEEEFLKDKYGKVDIDSLFLTESVYFIQYSISCYSDTYGLVSPEIKLFSISCGKRGSGEYYSSPVSSDYKSPGRLYVPYRSQGDEDREISGHICSPTSVSMVMEYWGVSIPTAEIARMCYDKEYDLYGIWPSAVQAACQYGFKGWIRIFRNWQQVEKQIAMGRPVIATICFGPNELEGSFTSSSEGHVIVITGFDMAGNPICNDPAGENGEEGILTYNRNQLERAWLWESGIGYVIIRQ